MPVNDRGAVSGAFPGVRGRLERFLAGRGWTHCFPTPAGLLVSQGGRVIPPPIRFTPLELDALATDYFLHGVDLRPGDLVIDVGCGMGTELLTYSDFIGPNGLILGFEAHPRSFQIAVSLQHLNELRNVRLFQLAVWNEESVVTISDDANSLGINSVVDSRLLQQAAIPVSAVSLDGFLSAEYGDREIGLLKMNIEGAEVRALTGATEALKRTRACVIACHDFVADEEGGDSVLRTRSLVEDLLADAGFHLSFREDHHLAAVRDTIYAHR